MLESLWKSSIFYIVYGYVKESETIKITLLIYLFVSLLLPIMVVLMSVIAFILGVEGVYENLIDFFKGYYTGTFPYSTIEAWRCHLVLLFLCWLFTLIALNGE